VNCELILPLTMSYPLCCRAASSNACLINVNFMPWMQRLLTPPDTPIFGSLDDEPASVNLVHNGRERSRPISISRSVTVSCHFNEFVIFVFCLYKSLLSSISTCVSLTHMANVTDGEKSQE